MTERDSDIDFDFFDEPETQETTQRRRAPREGGGPRRPRGPRPPIAVPGGLTPLLRLTLLVLFAIFLIVVLVLWVQSCQGASKRSEYASYMSKVESIAKGSAGVGRQLNDALTTPAVKEAAIETKGIAPLKSELDAITAIKDRKELSQIIGGHLRADSPHHHIQDHRGHADAKEHDGQRRQALDQNADKEVKEQLRPCEALADVRDREYDRGQHHRDRRPKITLETALQVSANGALFGNGG